MNARIDRKKFEYILDRRIKSNPIIKVMCTKPKDESLKVYLIRKKTWYDYIEIMFAHELVKYVNNEWIQIQDVVSKHKGIHAHELNLALQ